MKYRKFKNPEIYLFYKTLVLSIICVECRDKNKRMFKEEESIGILKILGLFKNI